MKGGQIDREGWSVYLKYTAFVEKETRKLHERFLKEKKALHAQFVAERQAEYAKGQGKDYV